MSVASALDFCLALLDIVAILFAFFLYAWPFCGLIAARLEPVVFRWYGVPAPPRRRVLILPRDWRDLGVMACQYLLLLAIFPRLAEGTPAVAAQNIALIAASVVYSLTYWLVWAAEASARLLRRRRARGSRSALAARSRARSASTYIAPAAARSSLPRPRD